MYTISNDSKYELIIKNSRFITLMYKIDNELFAKDILCKVRDEYPDATHYCYAYIVNNMVKSSDDGEPAGTAGIPILKVLENNNLTNVLVIVIRYFGGIKLGASGLIRTYSKVVANAIKDNDLKELIDGYNLLINFNYQDVKRIDYLLKEIKINKKYFDSIVTYDIDIDNSFLEVIINNQIEYKIIRKISIEK